MKKIILGALLLLSIAAFSQKLNSKDTIYINSIPVGVIDNITIYPMTDFVDILSFNLVEDKYLKNICHDVLKTDDRFIITNIVEYKNINTENYDLKKIGEFAIKTPKVISNDAFPKEVKGVDTPKPVIDDELRNNLNSAGNLYDARNIVFLLGCIGTYGLIKNGDVTTGAVIGGVSMITAIILDFCGNSKLKTKKSPEEIYQKDNKYYWED